MEADLDLPRPRRRINPRHPFWRYLASTVLLVASIAVIARTAIEASRRPSMWATPPIAAFPDEAEHNRRLRDVVGTFATGTTVGERTLTIRADGTLQFAPVGPLAAALQIDDTYQLGRYNNRTTLATRQCGLIEVLDLDRLTCFGDVYERKK